MELHQIQITYRADDDRLLLRASFKAEDGLQEIRAWLTRRLVRNLWPGIVKAMETQVTLTRPQAAHAKADIIGMGHEASLSRIRQAGGFHAQFAPATTGYPLGERPLLITAAEFHVAAGKPLRIRFVPRKGSSFEISLRSATLHGFCSLLQDAVQTADWDIELQLPGTSGLETASRAIN